MKLGVMFALLVTVGAVELKRAPNEGDFQDEGSPTRTAFPGRLTAKNNNNEYNTDIIRKSQSLTTLEFPIWMINAGLEKGYRHDRQHLGIILASGQRMRIRQVDDTLSEDFFLRLLNDDHETETLRQFGKTWVEVSLDTVSVPFVDTPVGEGAPKIEFEYPSAAKILPVYHTGENESSFFNSWDVQDAEFALVESDFINILVPKIDKGKLKSMGTIKNIDELILLYEGVFTFYNSLAGLSFEAECDTDRNIKNRYFVKADKSRPNCWAYYKTEWLAECTNSVTNFWLEPTHDEWGHLHEIAHGYEGNFMKDKYFRTGEVWNNVYGACYQEVMLADEIKYEKGWLYRGKFPKFEKEIIDYISQAKPVNEWNVGQKLYFIMLMVNKGGKNSFTHFNREYRKDSNTFGFDHYKHDLLDRLSESFAHSGNEVDVTPFVQLVGGYISPAQVIKNYFSHAKAVYPLYQLVKAEVLEKIKIQLRLDTMTSLVDSEQLKVTGLKGSVKLRLNIDDFSQISGEVLRLMEGSRYAFKAQINSPEIVLSDLPIGVYTLRLPTGKDKKYQFNPSYLVLKQGESEAEINFVRKKSSAVISQEINLIGWSTDKFAVVAVNQALGMITVDFVYDGPYLRNRNKTYGQVTIKNKDGFVKFSKDIRGKIEKLTKDEIPFEFGDTIEIYQAFPPALQVQLPNPDIFDIEKTNNTLLITKSGLKNEALNNDPEEGLMKRLENAVLNLRNFNVAYNAEFSTFKDDIYMAIDVFASPRREELLKLYQDCLPSYH